jgi:ABC-2 type transport system permease protein
MLTRIMKHEWRNLAADRAVWLMLGLFVLLIGYGIYNGASRAVRVRESGREMMQGGKKELSRLKAQLIEKTNQEKVHAGGRDATDPFSIEGQFAVLPPAPLAALSVGQSDVMPGYRSVSVNTQQRTVSDKYGFENPLNLLAGRFDLSFVMVYLFPLLVLSLSYNLLSAEREQGTLALLLSQPIRLSKFVLGKIYLRALVIFALVIVLSVAILFASGVTLSRTAASGLLLWAGLIIAYGAFWFSLALAVNALGHGSATNAVILAALWIAFVLGAPSIISIVATSRYPVPSRSEMVAAMRDLPLDLRRDGKRILADFYSNHPELRPKDSAPKTDDLGLAFVNIQQEQKRVGDEVEARFDDQLARQQALVNRFRFISPAVVAQEAMNDVAGTGTARYHHFRSLVRDQARAWDDYFVPRMYRQDKLTAADYDAMPRFVFREEASINLFGRVLTGIVGLNLPTIVIGLFGIRRLNRFELTEPSHLLPARSGHSDMVRMRTEEA